MPRAVNIREVGPPSEGSAAPTGPEAAVVAASRKVREKTQERPPMYGTHRTRNLHLVVVVTERHD